jgi:NAD(P)H-dependent flavin oxidoreductase YrpB (nitropropane dioxygenase family)
MWSTEITRQLGIKFPFVGAGMAIVGSPELAAAVSNAGGVGLSASGLARRRCSPTGLTAFAA